MPKTVLTAGAGCAALLLATTLAGAQQASPAQAPLATATAQIQTQKGEKAGTVTATQHPGGVVLRGNVDHLPPGWHAVHVHETGQCQGDFKSAGGHFNPTGAHHGLAQGAGHAGDLPNFHVADDGTGEFEVIAGHFSIMPPQTAAAGAPGPAGMAGQAAPSIFDQDGAAIVIHAAPDDYTTDPAGNSGDRIACGVLRPG